MTTVRAIPALKAASSGKTPTNPALDRATGTIARTTSHLEQRDGRTWRVSSDGYEANLDNPAWTVPSAPEVEVIKEVKPPAPARPRKAKASPAPVVRHSETNTPEGNVSARPQKTVACRTCGLTVGIGEDGRMAPHNAISSTRCPAEPTDHQPVSRITDTPASSPEREAFKRAGLAPPSGIAVIGNGLTVRTRRRA